MKKDITKEYTLSFKTIDFDAIFNKLIRQSFLIRKAKSKVAATVTKMLSKCSHEIIHENVSTFYVVLIF